MDLGDKTITQTTTTTDPDRQDHIPAAVGVLGYLVDGNDGVLVGSASLKANGLSVVSNTA